MLQIVARQEGGLFGGTRETTVTGERISVQDTLGRHVEALLAEDDAAELERLAAELVAAGDHVEVPVGAVDGRSTELDVTLDDQTCTIRMWLGEDVPDPVWALLDALEWATAGAAGVS